MMYLPIINGAVEGLLIVNGIFLFAGLFGNFKNKINLILIFILFNYFNDFIFFHFFFLRIRMVFIRLYYFWNNS
jgi:hypothetical protein